jgi:hypothetical protein
MKTFPCHLTRKFLCVVLGLCASHTSLAAAPPTLTSNSYSSLGITGAVDPKIKGQLVYIQQNYSDASRKKYLFVDLSVAYPNPALGVSSTTAGKFSALLFHPGTTTPYAQCSLEARVVSGKLASFSLGLKSTGSDALIRWGVCDDPNLPGHDSLFPALQTGDRMQIIAPNGSTEVGQYLIPKAPTNTTPSTASKNYAVLAILEGKSYKVAP